MTSKNSVGDDLIVTDAVLSTSPSDPKISNNNSTSNNLDNGDDITYEQINEKPKGKKNFSKLVNTSINGAVINISNSSHVRVGSDIHYNIASNPKKDIKTDDKIPLTSTIEKLFLNSSKLDFRHLDFIASHLGCEWKTLGRKLEFSDGQLEQFQLDYKNYKLKEVFSHFKRRVGLKDQVIYQMLLAWSREYPEQAQLGHIAKVLWDCNFRDIVQRMANQF